ncbi:hypothetical protein DJ84_09075 [Halorubrum ezzemoulense]|nr:hypothetical protein DJ84_09075 [Halorubrum ezzemoulense]
MTENDQKRTAEMRINEADRDAIKKARDRCFDQSVPMGYVARYACEKLTEDAENASNVKL